jgi:predicted DNA-binding protein
MSKNQTRTNIIQVRLNDHELLKLETLARISGCTKSTYMRVLIDQIPDILVTGIKKNLD